MKFELEMSEKAFKNDASKIVNNPATGEMDMLDDDKQLASGLFNMEEQTMDQNPPSTKPEGGKPEELKSDVKNIERGIEKIDQATEWNQVFDKLIDKINTETVTGLTGAKVKALLIQTAKTLK